MSEEDEGDTGNGSEGGQEQMGPVVEREQTAAESDGEGQKSDVSDV